MTYSKSSNENGNLYQNDNGICVFEDVQETKPRYYSWVGDWDDHDHATHSPTFKNFERAEEWALKRKAAGKKITRWQRGS